LIIGLIKAKGLKMGRAKYSSGISMLEIIISMMILALVLVGLINVFVVSRGYMAHGRSRISASQLATVFLDPLQNEVNQTSWNTSANLLNVTTVDRVGTAVPIDGVYYTPTYNVTDQSSDTALRRVTVNITWNETK
jgi:Tfp pilus assembly protein PilV